MIFHPDRMNSHEVLPVTMRTLVVGVGNPILSDDGVGIFAARMLMERGIEGVSIEELPASGLELLDMVKALDPDDLVDSRTREVAQFWKQRAYDALGRELSPVAEALHAFNTQYRLWAAIAGAGTTGAAAATAIPIIGPLIAIGIMGTQVAAETAEEGKHRSYDREEELAADRFVEQDRRDGGSRGEQDEDQGPQRAPHHQSPSSRKLKNAASPRITWSTTGIPRIPPADRSLRVTSRSCPLGAGSPLGWLCMKCALVAPNRAAVDLTSDSSQAIPMLTELSVPEESILWARIRPFSSV